jgi:hypothetical protein
MNAGSHFDFVPGEQRDEMSIHKHLSVFEIAREVNELITVYGAWVLSAHDWCRLSAKLQEHKGEILWFRIEFCAALPTDVKSIDIDKFTTGLHCVAFLVATILVNGQHEL